MALNEACQQEKKILDEEDSLKSKDPEIGYDIVVAGLKDPEKGKTKFETETEIETKKISIKQSPCDGKQTELLSSSEPLQSTVKITLIDDDAKNGLKDKQSIEKALERPALRDDGANEYQKQIIETINKNRKEVDNKEEKEMEEKKEVDKDGKEFDIREYEEEIEKFLKNNEKPDYFKYDKEMADEYPHKYATNSKPNLSSKVTDPNLLDAVDPKNSCTPSFYELDPIFEKPSVICVIEPYDANDTETKVSQNSIDALAENEAKSSFLTTNCTVLEPQEKLTEIDSESVNDPPENAISSDEDNQLKAYLQSSFLLHRDSIAVSLVGKKNDKVKKINRKFNGERENLNPIHSNMKIIQELIPEDKATSSASNVSKVLREIPSKNDRNFISTGISGSLNDLSDSNSAKYSPIRPLRKKRHYPSVPTLNTFEQSETLSSDSKRPVPPRRKRRLGKPNYGKSSYDLLMTSKNCSYSLSDIHDMAIDDVEFLSLRKSDDSSSISSLPEHVLQSAFRKSKHCFPADVTWSTPEITDIVTEEGVITIKDMQHRASICILEASLPSLQHQRNHDQFAAEKTPVAVRKRSHTFTSGDRYMYEARKRANLKKSNTVSNLIRRTFSMKSLRKADNTPCMPNLFKRYKQRKKNLKRSKTSNLSTIHEDGGSNNEKTCHSFASIFMQDDEYGEDENGQTYLERCTANFEPYLSTSVLFPDMRRSSSNMELTADPPIVYQQFPLKKRYVRRSNSLLQWKPHFKLLSNESAYSLNAEAIKRAHELLNQKLANKPAISDDSPVPPVRSRSKLSLNSIVSDDDLDLNDINDKNVNALIEESILKNEAIPIKDGEPMEVNESSEEINTGIINGHQTKNCLHNIDTEDKLEEASQSTENDNINDKNVSALIGENILKKNEGNPIEDREPREVNESLEKINEGMVNYQITKKCPHKVSTEDKLEEASQSTESFSTIFSSNISFDPVEEIVLPAVFEENRSLKESEKYLGGLNSERVDVTSGDLTKVADELKEFERKRIDSISNHSKALKQVTEKIHGIQMSNHLHHELLTNNVVKRFSNDVEIPESNTSEGRMKAMKDRTEFVTGLDSPFLSEKSADKKDNELDYPLDDNVNSTNESVHDSKNSGAVMVNLDDIADERKKFERKRIDSIKNHSEVLNEITEKIQGIQVCNRLHHEVLMNNFVRRFSFDFENAGMANLSNSEVKIDGEMEAKKAISEFLKTLDSPTLLESLDKSTYEPSIQAEEPDPQMYCSVEHLEDLHRQSVPHDEELEVCKEEPGKVFVFPYGSATQSINFDGEQLARECEEGTINVKLQKITDMYTKDILHQTRKLSGDYERCASRYVSPHDILNPDKRLNFHNVNSDTEYESVSIMNDCKITPTAEKISKNLDCLGEELSEKLPYLESQNISSKTGDPKANNQEDSITDGNVNCCSLLNNSLVSPSKISTDEGTLTGPLEKPPSHGPKEEVLKQIINKNSLLFQTLYATSISQLQNSNVYYFPYQPNAENIVPHFLYTCDQILALSKSNPESPTTSPLHSPIISIRHSSNEHGTTVVEVESPISKRKYFVTAVKEENTPSDSSSAHPLKTPFDVNDTYEKSEDFVKDDVHSVDCVDSAIKRKDKRGTILPDQSLVPKLDSISSEFMNKNDRLINIKEFNPAPKVDSKISSELYSQKLRKKSKSNLKVKIPNSTMNTSDVELGEEMESSPYKGKNLKNEDGKIDNSDIKMKIEDVINEIGLSVEANYEAEAIRENGVGECREEHIMKNELVNDTHEIKEGGVIENGSLAPRNQFNDSKSEIVELKPEKVGSIYQSECDDSISKEPLNSDFKSSIKKNKKNLNKKSKKKEIKSKIKHEILFDSIIKPENYDDFIRACKTEPNRLEKTEIGEEKTDNEINNEESDKNGINSECKSEIKTSKRSEFFFKFINGDSRNNEAESEHLTEESNKLESNKLVSNKLESNKLESNKLESNKLESNKLESNNLESNKFESKKLESNLLEIRCCNQRDLNSINKLETESSNIIQTDFINGLETKCNNQLKDNSDKKPETLAINGMETCGNTQFESNIDIEMEPNLNNKLTFDSQLKDCCKPEMDSNCNDALDTDSINEQKIASTKDKSDFSYLVEESNVIDSNISNESEKRRIFKSEIKPFNLINNISSYHKFKEADHSDNGLENGEGKLESCSHINENETCLNSIAGKVDDYRHDKKRENHTNKFSENAKFDSEEINCVEEECYNHIKECCSIQCNCNAEDEAIKILAVHRKSRPETFLPITVRTWEERQAGEKKNVRSTVSLPIWIQNGLGLKPEMFQPKDTSLGHPHIEPSREEFERTSRAENQSSVGPQKEEDQIPQQDRCVEVYPETLRQRQRNMAPSPSKVDIKNWENNSGGSDEDSKGGKKFLPSVKALRSQFENGKSVNRDVSPSPPPSISPPIRENLNNLGRTSSNSSTSSLVMSSLEASSGFSSLASSQATSELLSKSLDDEPVEPIFNQFHPVCDDDRDSMCQPPSTIGWNPQPLLKKMYFIPEAPKMQSQGTNYINIDGYLEKLPSGRKKATFWNAWKRRYFVAKDGTLYYYQNNQTEKPNMKLPLMGGKVEIMDQHMVNIDDGEKNTRSASMLGIDDGKGHYVVVRCPTRQEAERWKKALDTHTVEDFSSQYVQPWPRPTNPTLLRDTLIIDIGSCSVRAGVLASQPTLPQLFFPSVVATNRETRNQIWGTDALMPQLRTNSSVAFPIRPSHKISKFSVDLNSISSLLQKTFKDLKVDPKNYNIQLSVPKVLNQITQVELLKILFEKFGVKAVNLTHQSILALYAYNATSGIVVDIGERIDVVPVTDGYIVDGGVSRIPYGGYRILDHIRQFLFQRNLSLVNEVDSYVIRQCLETVCYSAQHYNTEKQRCNLNTESFEKTVPLAEFFPNTPQYEAFRNISLDFGRFQATEGLFNPDAWGLDHPGLQKLVHKAIQECSMDIRKEMSRSIFLSGGLSQLPGISERLTVELDNLTPPAIHPKVHSSPYRYHAAYIGACVLAESPAFVQSKITKEEWQKQGNSALRKWAL